jgi:hypothetical protein
MDPAATREQLQEKFLLALLDAVRPLQNGPDPELLLEALIGAAGRLKEQLEAELAELRQEQAD